MSETRDIQIGSGLAAVLGIQQQSTRAAAAAGLARVAGLPLPAGAGSQKVLSEVVLAVQHHVIDHPDLPMDRAIVADYALSYACQEAGDGALRETFEELGNDSLDWYVRGALHSTVAPALAQQGLIDLIGR